MKVTVSWLKEYVDFDWSPEELAERLTMLGLEVEGMEAVGGGFEGIVVAEVIRREKHPNADKLSLCRVYDGQGERQIVCGAHNFESGDKVPLILPGASLPLKAGETKPFTIRVGTIRGCESQGMICSHQELGLDPEAIGLKRDDKGILVLRRDAQVGQPLAEYLGHADKDVVLDLETTPNRPDWNSAIGIARELAALTGNSLRMPDVQCSTSNIRTDDLVAVRIEDAELCHRYTARVIQGVKISPSPDWLRAKLEKIGIRSINNVVDVTNYVLMEIGHPLHAFDYHLIAKGADGKPTVVIRRAKEGESFTTLDDQKHTLTPEHLLIADEQKGIALAGVMGGQNTEINDQTVDVLLESAWFNPTNIRRTSRVLGLRTDSSYRFERGADLGICDWASQRAAQLILETAGGALAGGGVDAYPQPAAARHVRLRPQKVAELLGIALNPEQICFYLGQLGLKPPPSARRPTAVGADVALERLTFEIPTFRVDLKREVDLIEEICRLHGIDKIPSTPPRGAHGSNDFDVVYDHLAEVRHILTGLGLHEAQGQTLISNSEWKIHSGEGIRLENPLSSDMDELRPSLLPGLIHALRHNVTRKSLRVALFEIGRVFPSVDHDPRQTARPVDRVDRPVQPPREDRRVAFALSGPRNATFWSGAEREAKLDAYDLKGILDEFLEQFGVRGTVYSRRAEATALFLDSASLALRGKGPFGELGLLQPGVARQYDLRDPVWLAELDVDTLLTRRTLSKSLKPLPPFPAIRRDVAMLVPEATTHDDILAVVRSTQPAYLETVELFDVFRGKPVPEGCKSLAYAFTFRSPERTLMDQEVSKEHARLTEAFKQRLHATVRE